MKSFVSMYRKYFTDKGFIVACFSGIGLLSFSIVANFYAGMYATEKASNAVTDIVLSNVHVFKVENIFVYGTILFWYFVTYVCLTCPQRIPLVLKSIALFVCIRSVFISLTHLGPFPDEIILDPGSILNNFVFGADQFFSGHTGLPFLLSLIFWDYFYLRLFFIFSAIVFGIIVLLGHLHYSIDVLAAFFITYSIYHIAIRFFKKDYNYFRYGLCEN